jgi:hypothetical protein
MISLRFFFGSMMGLAAAMLPVALITPPWQVALPVVALSMLVGGGWSHRSWVEKNDRTEKVERLWQLGGIEVPEDGLVGMSGRNLLRFIYQFEPGENKIRRAHRLSRSILAPLFVLPLLSLVLLFVAAEGGSIHVRTPRSLENGKGGISPPALSVPNSKTTAQPTPERKATKKSKHKKATSKHKRSQPAVEKRQQTHSKAAKGVGIINIRKRPVFGTLGLLAGLLSLMSLPLLFYWKWSARIITNRHHIDAWVPPYWLPFLPVKFNVTSLAFMKDIDPANTLSSRLFGFGAWGSVKATIDYSDVKGGTSSVEHKMYNSVPKHETYATELRYAAHEAGGMTSLRQDFQEAAAESATQS